MSTIYSEGDLVEAVKGEERHRGRVCFRGRSRPRLGESGLSIEYYINQRWTLTVIEAAPPKLELPTETGVYLDKDGEAWGIYPHGRMRGWAYDPDTDPLGYAPFTRLEPVRVTAKAVLYRFLEQASEVNLTEWSALEGCVNEVAAEFGVTGEVTE